MGWSQKKLAEGLCTQGTISNIEKATFFPSAKLLMEIGTKMDIEIDIYNAFLGEKKTIENVLNKVSKLSARDENEQVYFELTGKINVSKITDNSLKKKYYYYLGMSHYRGFGELDKAEEYFSKVIDNYKMKNEIEDVLIYVGMGIVNYEKRNKELAHDWFEKAVSALKKEEFFIEDNIRELLKIYYNLAKYYSLTSNHEKSLELCELGLYWAHELDSNYHLGHLLYEKAFNLYQLGDAVNSEFNYNLALVQSYVCKQEVVQKTIRADAERFNLELFY